jgi:hypothetical protein
MVRNNVEDVSVDIEEMAAESIRSFDNKTLMKYAGRRFADGSGFLEVGLTKDMYYDQIRMSELC